MGGPQLEVMKFAFYVFYPVGTMLYFGSPFFHENYIKHMKFWPDYEITYKPPTTPEDVKTKLDQLKEERLERWAALKNS